MCKDKKYCGKDCKCKERKEETFQKTKNVNQIKVNSYEQIKHKNDGKETFGI